MATSPPVASDYRLARPVLARFGGAVVVALAAVYAVVTLVVALTDLGVGVLAVVAAVALVAAVAAVVALSRVVVVRLGPEGYRVRLLRGAGVEQAGWRDVAEAVTTTADATPVVVLRLVDGRTTTIPVGVLAGDRDAFAADLRGHLRDGQGLRPLT